MKYKYFSCASFSLSLKIIKKVTIIEMCNHDLKELFLQLGLLSEKHEIEAFASTHSLIAGVRLADAPFWSVSQKQFLFEALEHDSAWSNATDHLANLLNRIPAPVIDN